MPCEHWKDEWVARLYDELSPDEERELAAHLERCGACRRTLDELAASRSWLEQCAPAVPPTPRVVVLRDRRPRRTAWAFAAGAAAAVVVFALGIWAAPPRQSVDGPLEALLTRDELRDELKRVERRLDRERARDLEYLLRSMTAAEMRTGTWMDQTQEAIHFLTLSQDPRFREK